ncbi:hypothetical protein [Candidatus Nasuia deltocephalinicola]|uniref:hypothetical protein n=1 Tax=Candidatus Nasuia deltocephalincola TaxID=1160784 RepID=UPI00216B3F2C|nr:hypothetical protein [Candidatus Nasuia deltocephalinicola]
MDKRLLYKKSLKSKFKTFYKKIKNYYLKYDKILFLNKIDIIGKKIFKFNKFIKLKKKLFVFFKNNTFI